MLGLADICFLHVGSASVSYSLDQQIYLFCFGRWFSSWLFLTGWFRNRCFLLFGLADECFLQVGSDDMLFVVWFSSWLFPTG